MSELQIYYGGAPDLIRDAQAVRRTVFIEGQNVPEARELDGLDSGAEHYVGYIADSPVAVARTRPIYLEEDQVGSHDLKIERVGVLADCRGLGYGRQIMAFILDQAERQPLVRNAILESQVHALPFYAELGFTAYGRQFQDAGIPHKRMRKVVHADTLFQSQNSGETAETGPDSSEPTPLERLYTVLINAAEEMEGQKPTDPGKVADMFIEGGKVRLENAIATLDERSQGVLAMRFGLSGERSLALDTIGMYYRLTRERIRQIEKQALKDLISALSQADSK